MRLLITIWYDKSFGIAWWDEKSKAIPNEDTPIIAQYDPLDEKDMIAFGKKIVDMLKGTEHKND